MIAALHARALRASVTPLRPFTRGLFSQSAPQSRRSPLVTGFYAAAFALSAGLFTVYYFDARSNLHRYIVMPVMRGLFDAETGHKLAVQVLRSGLSPRDPLPDDPQLKCEMWGKVLSNPIGVAAGFDKHGEAIDGALQDLGFSWVEIGSVTPQPQPGNPKPRMFRLSEDDAIINRYGFPSQGHAAVVARLRKRTPKFLAPEQDTAAFKPHALLAVNLGKNKMSPADSAEDFVSGVHAFGPHSDVLVINVSSPNTPGLRGLQDSELLQNLLAEVANARSLLSASSVVANKPKLVVKLSPDLTKQQLFGVAEVIRNSSVDGVIISNTTVQRPDSLKDSNKGEKGGLSGAPLKPITLAALKTMRAELPASIPIIGCGGIATGADALEYAKAGASMVQVYTSFGYDGVGACRRIKDQLLMELSKEGKSWQQVVDESIARLSRKKTLTTEGEVKALAASTL
ncbi:hypothetical protein FISHEDRAFT_34388 [Fistulina hepatica ATCC 64428]|uniref:Dihydroorotate dehydrogenase (quinone), mitochondrial n=1 Tax=Fistulina hepatica ATCC 64428 TaxID=1128425 RepID=A0A0D7AMN2_9AGAR|nr:hypothetical protein FISHEDRAFT_34388 [Fistulina hepatica ATCC 64428]